MICLVYSGPHDVYSQEEEGGIFSTRFCTVFYEEGVELALVNRLINLNFSDFYNPRGFREDVDLRVEEILSEKFDAIFSRAEDILDMFPPKIHVRINIYRAREGLDAAYEEIFDAPNEAVSFYIYKTNTIYMTQDAISEDILAHEIAHCIIDHYFVILPPRKIQEMLAAYVDVHLED
ncbi:hypothetical protein ACFL28_00130 [Candidatus Omnitrophota bacterium]